MAPHPLPPRLMSRKLVLEPGILLGDLSVPGSGMACYLPAPKPDSAESLPEKCFTCQGPSLATQAAVHPRGLSERAARRHGCLCWKEGPVTTSALFLSASVSHQCGESLSYWQEWDGLLEEPPCSTPRIKMPWNPRRCGWHSSVCEFCSLSSFHSI